MTSRLTCQICGTSNEPAAAFCETCGAALGQEAASPTDIICPRCGALNSGVDFRHRFCAKCRADLSRAPTVGSKVFVREYNSQGDYQRDAGTLSVQGWRVTSVNQERQNAGCMRILTLGLFSLVVRPKDHYVVTYTRD